MYPRVLLTVLLFTCFSSYQSKTFAQTKITSDGTIPTNVDNSNEGIYQITGGSRPNNGANLFHSFEVFSLDSGDFAQFVHNSAINNIITRITGGSISEIDGTIQTLIEGTNNRGTANFFFINPAGIQLGENATLEIGGSFIGSTAESVQFADGTEFSAINPASTSLLTISVPTGLQYGANPGTLEVQGIGNNISTDPVTFATNRTNRPVGFQVPLGQTLALLGGNILLEGGNVTAEAGRIELWSVANGQLSLIEQNEQLTIDQTQGIEFRDITLSQAASVDTTGEGGGDIQLQGRRIELQEGSVISGSTLGTDSGGLIEVQASETLDIQGLSENNLFSSSIFSEVEPGATGASGNINIDTERLFLGEGGTIFLGTFSSGETASLSINASDIEIRSVNPANGAPSALANFIFFGASGNAGDINIDTERLVITQGGNISTSSLGLGTGGSLIVNAQEIELLGESGGSQSGLFSIVFPGAPGDGGSIAVNTDSLNITEGATISVSTFGDGDAGAISVIAQDIEILGFDTVGLFASSFSASVFPGATGTGGTIKVQTENLSLNNGGQITSSTFGAGNAGQLQVTAQNIEVVGFSPEGFFPSALFALVRTGGTGNGGTLEIQTGSLVMREGGQIAASTFGSGNAGDLSVQADSIDLRGVGDSGRTGLFSIAIIEDGDGGNVTMTANELEVRDGATISVGNFQSLGLSDPGQGAAGNLILNVPNIILDDGGIITADANNGDQGNILITTQNLQLQEESTISTDARGTATGGNITIDTTTLVGLNNSDITANSLASFGGQVVINAEGIFGIEFREALTPESDITASSELGAQFSGVVELNTPDSEPFKGILELPANVVDASKFVDRGCAAYQGNEFTLSGRGGLPENPINSLRGRTLWQDRRKPQAITPTSETISTIIEAQGWILDENGTVILTEKPTQLTLASSGRRPLNCY